MIRSQSSTAAVRNFRREFVCRGIVGSDWCGVFVRFAVIKKDAPKFQDKTVGVFIPTLKNWSFGVKSKPDPLGQDSLFPSRQIVFAYRREHLYNHRILQGLSRMLDAAGQAPAVSGRHIRYLPVDLESEPA
jgi:hypothetical protein